MGDLFSGLEEFGLKNLNGMNIYEKEETKEEGGLTKKVAPKLVESDFLFDKTYTCPVCDNMFKSKMVKVGRVKLLSADSDLRPKYQTVDSLKYDAIVCPKCGYAALNRFFNYMTMNQSKLVREKISATFKPLTEQGDMYTYDEAIMRHKLALVNSIVMNAKFSEKAYTCLKLAWLFRGKSESLPVDTKEIEKVRLALKKQEDEFLANAYEGFCTAIMKEGYPMCGMDENTVLYLVAELARRCKKFDESLKLLSKLLVSRDANERIKQKAREIKDKIREECSAKK